MKCYPSINSPTTQLRHEPSLLKHLASMVNPCKQFLRPIPIPLAVHPILSRHVLLFVLQFPCRSIYQRMRSRRNLLILQDAGSRYLRIAVCKFDEPQ